MHGHRCRVFTVTRCFQVSSSGGDPLKNGKVVTPIDVLVGLQLLKRTDFEDGRRGRVAYLERVINCDLTRWSRGFAFISFHDHDLNLVPSTTD
jgi:hypothetical protein